MRKTAEKSPGSAKGEMKNGFDAGIRPNPDGEPDFKNAALARLVRSKAGHDKDSFLVIVGIADEEHVLVSDGRLRTVEKPKKKKLRHLEITETFSGEIRERLINNCPIQNAELRRFIASALDAGEK